MDGTEQRGNGAQPNMRAWLEIQGSWMGREREDNEGGVLEKQETMRCTVKGQILGHPVCQKAHGRECPTVHRARRPHMLDI